MQTTMQACSICGRRVRTTEVDNLNLCLICYADYLHRGSYDSCDDCGRKERLHHLGSRWLCSNCYDIRRESL